MSNDNSPGPVTFSDPASSGMHLHRSNGLAFAEGASLLGVVAVLDYTGLLSFELVPVHPYLFVVILLSAQYGIQGGILAALGAVTLSHVSGLPTRPFDMSHAEYFRMVWADSLSWVLAALTVGIVTTRRGRVLQEQTARLRKATLAESLIAAQYQVLAQRTHKLERSLAGRADASSDEVRAQAPTRQGEWAKPPSRARGRGHSRQLNAEGYP